MRAPAIADLSFTACVGKHFKVIGIWLTTVDDDRRAFIGQTGECIGVSGFTLMLRFDCGLHSRFDAQSLQLVMTPPAAPIDG